MEFRLEVLCLFFINIVLLFTIRELATQNTANDHLVRLEIIRDKQKHLVSLTADLKKEKAISYRRLMAGDLRPTVSYGKAENFELVVSLYNADNIEMEEKNMREHCSWNNYNFTFNELAKLQAACNDSPSQYAENYQLGLIPVFDAAALNLEDDNIQRDIYDTFFNQTGVVVIRNVYSKELMDKYNQWSEMTLEKTKNDPNARHPKQKHKYLINDLWNRMGETDPDMLLKLLADKQLNTLQDTLLGFGKYGAATTHWIEPGGDRQQSHVDYPLHVGSGPFWEHSPLKLKSLTTQYQVNQMMTKYSVQILIASDAMSVANGSTECVPCSHLMDNLDVAIHDPQVYKQFEKCFVNVTLGQGDILIFNRALCHRGGKNISSFRRNSLIMQCVWLWGVGQEIIDSAKVIETLEAKSQVYRNMTDEEKATFQLRIKAPYPLDTVKST